MNTAKAQAKLSESEFKEMLLSCIIGEAHKFLADWIENSSQNVASTYHQLALRFDSRIDPESAHITLFTYTASKKQKRSPKVESELMVLAYGACDIYPIGASRIH